jgi:hypothetical protein
MTPQTILLRQIHPTFIQAERVTSQAFRPTPKDENRLSVDDGDRISAEEAWQRFTRQPKWQSAGVMGITVEECNQRSLPVIADGVPYAEHVSIDFQHLANKQIEKIAKLLATQARQRGWLYRATGA